MIAIPALDLLNGVRAAQNSGAMQSRSNRSLDVARAMTEFGFRCLHVTDRASRVPSHVPFVEELIRDTHARVQVAGVNSTSAIEQLLSVGAAQVVVGARALDEPEWLAQIADLYPGEVSVATDVHDRRVVRRGWVRTLPVDILDVVDELNAFNIRELLINIRPLDADTRGVDLSLLEDVAERSHAPVAVAGGVSNIQDLRALEHRGIAASVIDADRFLDGAIDGHRAAQEFGA